MHLSAWNTIFFFSFFIDLKIEGLISKEQSYVLSSCFLPTSDTSTLLIFRNICLIFTEPSTTKFEICKLWLNKNWSSFDNTPLGTQKKKGEFFCSRCEALYSVFYFPLCQYKLPQQSEPVSVMWMPRCSAISAPSDHLVVQNYKLYFSTWRWGAEQGSWTISAHLQTCTGLVLAQAKAALGAWQLLTPTACAQPSPLQQPRRSVAGKWIGEGIEIGRIFWNAPKGSTSKEDRELALLLNVCVFIYHGEYWEIHEGRTQGQLLNPWLLPLSCRERRQAQEGRGGFLCRWQSLRNNHSYAH